MSDETIKVFFARDQYGDIVYETFSRSELELDDWFFDDSKTEGWERCNAILMTPWNTKC